MAQNKQHAALFLELADAIEPDEPIGTVARPPHPLAARARAAAEELEERKVPTDRELLQLVSETIEPYDMVKPGEYEEETECALEVYGSELVAYARAVLAHFGGGEGLTADDWIKAAYASGYARGHNDTVEACYADPNEVAIEMCEQIKNEALDHFGGGEV